jgi:para-nitrobenzyl esterase
MESGSVPLRMQTRADAEQKGLELQRTLGISEGPEALARLRQVPAEKLLVPGAGDDRLPGAGLKSLPCAGGYALPEAPAAVFTAGRQAQVPVMAGSNADEGTLWSRRLPVDTVLKWRMALRALLGADAAQASRLYPVQTDADVQAAVDQFIGDPFVAGARRMVRWMAATEPEVYLYHFTRVNAAGERSRLGAFHGAELPYVFHSLPPLMGMKQADEELSEAMMGYWTRFATTGDPNGAGAAVWPRYTTAQDQHLRLDVPIAVGQGLRREQCDLWDGIQSRQIQ